MKRIAVNLVKSVYRVAESARSGQVAQCRRLNREVFRRYIQEQAEPVEWVMEACGTANYWGRVAQALGHQVRLLHPRYARSYRRRNKINRSDYDAMLEATRCTDIHPVPVKSHGQQQLQQLHGLRETWKKSRTQRINLLRSLLHEAGVETPALTVTFIRATGERVDRPRPAPLSRLLHIILAEINLYEQYMARCEQQLKRWHAGDDIVRKLDEVSDIEPLTASALATAVGRPKHFTSSHQLSTWLDMTPREFSSGEHRKLGRTNRQDNVYIRALLIRDSRTALLATQRCQARTPEKLAQLQHWAVATAIRIGHNKAAIALTNKLVRICWAVWCHERRFNGD